MPNNTKKICLMEIRAIINKNASHCYARTESESELKEIVKANSFLNKLYSIKVIGYSIIEGEDFYDYVLGNVAHLNDIYDRLELRSGEDCIREII